MAPHSSRSELGRRVRLSPDSRCRVIDGETVFVQLAASTYFSLDAVGTRMLEGVLSAASVAEALPALQREFEAEPAAIESDLLGLLQELRAAGLIEIVTPS